MRIGQRLFDFVGTLPLAVGLAYFVCAAAALYVTGGSDGVATVWPASGVSIAGLLLAPPRQRGAVYLAIAAGSLAANLLAGLGLYYTLAFTAANVAEATIGYLCIRHINRDSETVYNPLSVVEFCLAALLTGTLSGAIATAFTGGGLGLMFLSWATTVSLGIMIVVPLALNISVNYAGLRSILQANWLLPLLILLLVGAITYTVFNQTTFPLLFLPLMAVIVATYLVGPNGALASILIIAVIGSHKTLQHSGPIHLMREHDPIGATLFLQFYLFALLLSSLPLAALLNARDRVITQVSRANRWLAMSEHIAHVGHWRLDLAREEVFWSDEVFRIHGLSPGAPPPLDGAIGFYHPDDRDKVRQYLAALVETYEPFEFEARLITAAGIERYVRSLGEVERNTKGEPIGLFGIFQDVTERTLATQRLAAAHKRAEEQADYAMILAQTDSLTGIANRRNAIGVLGSELEKAHDQHSALSVAILDIDHFKSINDNFGHAAGDAVIRQVAQLCQGMIRTSDLAGRIGGEEFVLILPGSDADSARIVGERLRLAIENAQWPEDGPEHVTASIGLATLGTAQSAEQFLAEADAALYRAKREGRNRLRVAA
ncbi:diguanylate cyclase [Novosphingobium profundi]|uniref:sensor domain-containing diguanylate cyclase n=1 Tax=Novosphingobium profundi TaxID=1774954 RepID=UPI001BD958A8|nr:sensor domain-containing diguanylate cyclase [Novosphingobium profundi]MBT0671354.1 diguanylate cyclase [Novosphingobium profundi]